MKLRNVIATVVLFLLLNMFLSFDSLAGYDIYSVFWDSLDKDSTSNKDIELFLSQSRDIHILDARNEGAEEVILLNFAEAATKYVLPSKLYIRNTPDATVEGSLIGEVYKGDKVKVLRYNNNWCYTLYEGRIAYVASKYLVDDMNSKQAVEYASTSYVPLTSYAYDHVLTKSLGRVNGPSGQETYYNLNMNGCVKRMHNMGYSGEYWVRSDGVKMFGDYIMVAADFSIRPLGTIIECSLGTAIVVDTGEFAAVNPTQLDVAVNW